MSEQQTFVIVGGGLAGAKAAQTLREEGFGGRVVLVGAEPETPYERPPLSKKFLTGDSPREEADVHPAAFYAEHDIDLRTGVAATAVDPVEHRVDLDDGTSVHYDRLLLATGSVPLRPPIPGADLEGVVTLRTAADADRLRERIKAGPVAIIGAGWIGCEVAAAARALGAPVTLIEMAPTPLHAVLGPDLGGLYGEVHREQGVRLLTGARVERIEGSGRVERVVLAEGDPVECATVVLGVGIRPDVRLAEAAGLEVDSGIVVDEQLRTSDPAVFAAGDVANALHPRYGRHIRVEHWANALNQGIAAARSMLDRGEPYARLPYFYSDQYTVGMEYVGLHAPTDRLVVRGRLDGRNLQAFWVGADGRVTAGLHLNQWDATEQIKALIERDDVVDPDRLADPAVPLDAVAAGASPGAGEAVSASGSGETP